MEKTTAVVLLRNCVLAALIVAACHPAHAQSVVGAQISGVITDPTGAVIPADLAILKPKLRTGLETDRIAVLYPDRRLDYFADARWSGPLGEVLQDLAVQEFHSRANLRTVSADASVFASAYWLEIEITDFQAEYTPPATAPTVHVRLLARLGNSGDRHIVGQFRADPGAVRRHSRDTRTSRARDESPVLAGG